MMFGGFVVGLTVQAFTVSFGEPREGDLVMLISDLC